MRRVALVLFLWSQLGVTAWAQDKPLPPPKDFRPETRRATDVLPALTLPEYVITGTDLLAFTEDRKKFIDEPAAADFTSRVGRGQREQRYMGTAPTRLPLGLRDLPGNLRVFGARLGYGTFHTPLAHAWFADHFTRGDIGVEAAYEASRGHVPRADYKTGELRVQGGTWLPRDITPLFASSRIEGDVEFGATRYGLYADKLQRLDPSMEFTRSGNHLRLGVGLISRRNAVIDHELSMFYAHSALEEHLALRDTLPLGTYEQAEQRFGIDGRVRTTWNDFPIEANIGLHVADMSERAADATRPYHLALAGRSRYALSEQWRLDGGVTMYLYRGNDDASSFRLYPSLRATWQMDESYALWLAYEPEVRERTFHALRNENPFLMLASAIRHTDIPMLFSAGIALDDRRATAGRMYVEYISSNSWGSYSPLPDPVRQQWSLRYGAQSRMFALHADIQHRFTERTQAQATLSLRSSHDEELDNAVPYLPSMELRAIVSHKLPFDLEVQANAHLTGEQEAGSGTIPAWMLVGAEIRWRPWTHAGLFLLFTNALDQRYQRWKGYHERPFFMMGGVEVGF
ncbi:MAG TPA: hypothetical protein PK916_05560 [Bacteroidota bacterium]|nr:hypothetical protein [Bacteroidota bacterium]